jgi:PAS domain S-box-containing protein
MILGYLACGYRFNAIKPIIMRGSFMKNSIRLMIVFFILSLPAECLASLKAGGSLHEITVVSDDNYPPYVFRDTDGKVQGILVDQWKLWEKKTGIRVILIATDWAKALEIMEEGKADVIDTIFFTEKRAQIFDYSRPYAKIEVPIFFHKNISGINSIKSAQGFTIGVKKGDACIEVFKSNGIINLVEYNSYEDIVKDASLEKLRVFCIDKPPALYFLNKYKIDQDFRYSVPLYTGEFHRAVKKGRKDLLKYVEDGFSRITENEYSSIDKKWFGTSLIKPIYLKYVWIIFGIITATFILLISFSLFLRRQVKVKTSDLTRANLLLEEKVQDLVRAKGDLKESEHRYRMIAENVHDTIWIIDLNLQFTYVSLSVERITGYTPEEIQNLRLEQLLKSSSYALATQVLSEELDKENSGEIIDPDRPRTMEFELIRKDGNPVCIEFTATFRRDDTGRPVQILGVSRDITERKQAEETLRQSEAKYRFLTEKMNDIIWLTDLDFRLTYISPSVEKILGLTPEERLRQTPAEMMSPEALSHAFNILNRELEREYEEGVDPERTVKLDMDFCHKNGSIVPMESVMSAIRDHDNTIIGIHGVSRDITERKRAEEEKKRLEAQLAQAQKLESIGTLAGGIAHDFNNILAAIIGYAGLAINDISEPAKARGELNEVLKAGDRAKRLVSQILAFGRQTETRHSPLELQPVIKESIKMMRSIIPTTIEIRQKIIDSGLVMSDPTQINQIIMNLCTNAVHAMDKSGGVLEVGLKRVNINGDEKTPDLGLPPGHYLKLSVSDTGQGMTPEVKARIFDPYFTTKEVGRGTGLGLSVVHGIVKSHGGVITCRSTYGQGSVLDIYLPEINTKDESSDPYLEKRPLPVGTERILFVDDEPVLIELAKRMIENLGYTVHTRMSSLEAFELFRSDPYKFDLVITDMTMPGITGDKLAQRMMEIRRDIPIILCTGYSEHITEEMAKKIGIREFVMKPLVVKELSKTIREVLDER